MKKILLMVVAVFGLACSDATGPEMKQVEPPEAALINCTQMINVGNIVVVDVSPENQLFAFAGSGSLTAVVIRDNTSIPGVQYHCQDYNATVTFQVLGFLAGAWQLYDVQKQSARIRQVGGSAGAWSLVRGYIGTKADTVRVETY